MNQQNSPITITPDSDKLENEPSFLETDAVEALVNQAVSEENLEQALLLLNSAMKKNRPPGL